MDRMRTGWVMAALVLSSGCGLSIDFLAPGPIEQDASTSPDASAEDATIVDSAAVDTAVVVNDAASDPMVVDSAPDAVPDVIDMGCGVVDFPVAQDGEQDGIPNARDPWGARCNPVVFRDNLMGSMGVPGGWTTQDVVTTHPQGLGLLDSVLTSSRDLSGAQYYEAAFYGSRPGVRWMGVSVFAGSIEVKCELEVRSTGAPVFHVYQYDDAVPIHNQNHASPSRTDRMIVSLYFDEMGRPQCQAFNSSGGSTGPFPVGPRLDESPARMSVFAYSTETHLQHVWVHEGPSTP